MIPFASIRICVIDRRISAIHIQISALHNRCDLRRIGVRLQAQLVLTFVDLLRIVAVDAVRRVPVGILLGEAADGRVVIPRAEVIGLRLAVEVLAAVAESANVHSLLLF